MVSPQFSKGGGGGGPPRPAPPPPPPGGGGARPHSPQLVMFSKLFFPNQVMGVVKRHTHSASALLLVFSNGHNCVFQTLTSVLLLEGTRALMADSAWTTSTGTGASALPDSVVPTAEQVRFDEVTVWIRRHPNHAGVIQNRIQESIPQILEVWPQLE